MTYSLAIIIPAYNEELSIAQTIQDYLSSFPEATLVVIDNNSSDQTRIVVENNLRSGKDCYLFESQQGKGFAVKKGLSRIEADIYVMTDGDLTYRARDAKKLLNIILEERGDMVVGDRLEGDRYKQQNKRSGHTFGNWFLTKIISAFSGRAYNDVLSGLRVMSRPFVEALDIGSKGFSLETELNIMAAYLKADVREEPIEYAERPEGSSSKLNTLVDGLKILYFAFINWITFVPIQFFSILSLISLSFATLIGMVLLNLYVTEGGITATATAVLGASFGIVGLLSIFIGLTLSVLVGNSRRQHIAHFLTSKRKWNRKLDNEN